MGGSLHFVHWGHEVGHPPNESTNPPKVSVQSPHCCIMVPWYRHPFVYYEFSHITRSVDMFSDILQHYLAK